MAIALDGTPVNNTSAGTPIDLDTGGGLTTSNSNCIIFVAVEQNSGDSLCSLSSSPSGLTFTRRKLGPTAGGGTFISTWYAVAPSPLTDEVITVTAGSGASYLEATALAFSGCDTSDIFDTHPAMPHYSSANPGYTLTCRSNSLRIMASRNLAGNPVASSGWTESNVGTYLLVQWKTSTTPEYLAVDDDGGSNGIICDALAEAGSADPARTMQIGTNWSGIAGDSPGSTAQPWINHMKCAQIWGAHEGGNSWDSTTGAVSLDANGYPDSMVCAAGTFIGHTADYIDVAFFNGFGEYSAAGYYPSGTYVFKWDGGDGSTSFTLTGDATGTFDGSSGRQTFTVTPSGAGFRIRITALGGTPPTNWRVCHEDNEAAMDGGALCNPDWLEKQQINRCIRVMQPLNVIGNTLTDYSAMQGIDYSYYYGSAGPPIEALVGAVNEVADYSGRSCDIWVTFLPFVTDAAVEDLCTRIYNASPNARVYTEYNNEIWLTQPDAMSTRGYDRFPGIKSINATFTGTIASNVLTITGISGSLPVSGGVLTGIRLWPSGVLFTTQASGTPGGNGTYNIEATADDGPVSMTAGTDFTARFHYGLMRQVQTNNIFRQKWIALGGDPANHVRVLAGNLGNDARNGLYLMTQTAAGGGQFTSDAYTFSTTDGSVSGTTFTEGAGLTGTVHIDQQLSGSGVPEATYIITDLGGGTWELNRDLGTISSQTFTGEYWDGAAVQAGDNTDYDKYFDVFCTAPYFESNATGAETYDTTYWSALTSSNTALVASLGLDILTCYTHGSGIPYVTYEGGQQEYARTSNAFDSTKDDLMRPAQDDSRMYTSYVNILDALNRGGCALFTHYSDIGEDRTWAHYFGSIKSVYFTPSTSYDDGNVSLATPKYNALFDFAADSNGTVTVYIPPLFNGPLGLRLFV